MRVMWRLVAGWLLAMGVVVGPAAWGDSHLPAPPGEDAALNAGDIVDPRQTAYREGLAAFDQGDFDRAFVVWKPLAENGYSIAQYSLAKLFDSGGGAIVQNPLQAALWYRQAAAQGVAAAQNNLAIMYARGRGVPQSMERAAQLWHQAAEGGHAMAKYNLALSYFNGDGVDVDRETAVDWFLRAGEARVSEAQFALGQLYRQGIGLPLDLELALAWYRAAADQGHGEAARQATLLHEAGVREEAPRPIPQDDTGATGAAGTTGAVVMAPDTFSPLAPLTTAPPEVVEPTLSPPADEIDATAGSHVAAGLEGESAEDENPGAQPGGQQDGQDPIPVDPVAQDSSADGTPPTEDRRTGDGTDVAAVAVPTEDLPREEPPAVAPQDPDLPPRPERKPSESLAMLAPQASGIDARWQPPLPRRNPKIASLGAGAAAGTMSDASQVDTARNVPSTATPYPKGSFAVWLASTSERQGADAFWGKAKSSYPEIFNGVTPQITRVDLGDLGIFYRLTAGPIQGKDSAETVCRQLRVHQPDAFCKIRAN